jgi:hypothetical protein
VDSFAQFCDGFCRSETGIEVGREGGKAVPEGDGVRRSEEITPVGLECAISRVLLVIVV